MRTPDVPRSAPLLAILVAAVAVAAQLPAAFPGAFLWDDVPLLVGNTLYVAPAEWSNLPAHWVDSVSVPLGVETWYWRPLATTSFMLETLVHGVTPTGFRITAALLHGAVAACAFVLLLRLLRSRVAATVGALAWALHPTNVEAVTWISGRFDLLAGLCSLGVLVAAGPDGAAATRARRWATGALAAAALLSKENAVVLPLLVVLWGTAVCPVGSWRELRTTRRTGAGVVLAGLVAAVALRFERLGFTFHTNAGVVDAAGGPLEHLLLVGRAAAAYAEALVMPWSGVGPAHHAVRPVPADDLLGWSGVLVLFAALALVAVLWRRRRRAALLLAACGVTLAPVLQIVPLDLAGGLHAADRYLYLPSFFAVAFASDLVLAFVRSLRPARPGAARAVVVAAGVVLAALLAGRLALLPRWSDPLRFWRWADRSAPRSSITLSNHVAVLLGDGWPGGEGLREAEAVARRLHLLDPALRHSYPYAEVLLAAGRADDAEEVLTKALSLHGDTVEDLLMRGRVRIASGRYAEARADFLKAVDLCGGGGAGFVSLLPEALGGAAEATARLGEDAFGAGDLADRAAAVVGSGRPAAVVQVARALYPTGRSAAAARVVGDGRRVPALRWPEILHAAAEAGASADVLTGFGAHARREGVPEAAITQALATGLERGGHWPRAVELYAHLVELEPARASAWDGYGYALFQTGDPEGCGRALRKAVECDADYVPALLHLGVLLRRKGSEDEGREVLERGLQVATSTGQTTLERLIRRQLARPAEDARDDGR